MFTDKRYKIPSFLKNKFILTLIIFFLWMLFFDPNNLIERFSNIHKINQLQRDKQYYLERIEKDRQRMKELMTDEENLEKFAREQYLMKKENEDIYVIIEED